MTVIRVLESSICVVDKRSIRITRLPLDSKA